MDKDINPAEEIKQCEIAYMESMRALDLETFMGFYHDDLLGWPSGQPDLVDKAAMRLAEAQEMAAIRPGSISIDLDIPGVRVFDHVGIIYCTLHYCATGVDDTPITADFRYTHTWLRTESGWKIIGGLSAPLATDN